MSAPPSTITARRRLAAWLGAGGRARTASELLDPATGVTGEEGLRLRLAAELSRARRHGSALTLLHVELVGLDAAAERGGQRAADELRRRAALGMAAAVRGEDLVARVGTDAFAVVLPGLTGEDVTRVTMRLAAVVARVRADDLAHAPLRVAVGAAAYPLVGATVDELLAAAAACRGEVHHVRVAVTADASCVAPAAAPWRVGAALRLQLLMAALVVAAWFGLPELTAAEPARRGILLFGFAAMIAGGLVLSRRTCGRERLGWRLFAASGVVAALPVIAVGAMVLFALAVLLIAGDGWLRDRFRMLDAAVCAALTAGAIVAFALPSAATYAATSGSEHIALMLRAIGVTVAGATILLATTSVSRRSRPDVWLLACGYLVPIVVSLIVLDHGGAWTPTASWKVVYMGAVITALGAIILRAGHPGPVERELRAGQADGTFVGVAGIAGFAGLMIATVLVHGSIEPAVVAVLVVIAVLRYVRAALIARDNRRLGGMALRAERERAAQNHAGLLALTAALEARDGYTGRHTEETTALTSRVAVALGLDAAERSEIDTVALLHDIGKIGTPNEILHKAGPLTDDEWAVMREHPVVGERILNAVPGLEDVARAVRHEHERWDGGGYPDGIAGEEIPLASRIVLVCDAFHAMTSDRPYRRAMPVAEAVKELRRCAGTQFDPAVVDALVDLLAAEPRRATPAPLSVAA